MLHDELLSRMIGLACACSTNPATDATDGLLMAGLLAVTGRCSMSDEQIVRLSERIRQDKEAVSPNCVSCTSRCGRTDDYNMARWHSAPEDISQLKKAILDGIADLVQSKGMQPFVYDALRALAEDWKAESFRWYEDEAIRLKGESLS